MLSIAVGGCTLQHVKKETLDLTLLHIFHYIHTVATRKLNTGLEGPIFDQAFTRASVAVGYISELTNPGDIFLYVLSFIEPSKKISPEEIALAFSLLRYCFVRAEQQIQAIEVTDYLKDLQIAFEKSKKNIVRNAIIQTLERVIQPQITQADMTAE